MHVRINSIRGEPACTALALGDHKDEDERYVSRVLVFNVEAQTPPESIRPPNVQYVETADIDERVPAFRRMLDEGVLIEVKRPRGRPPKSPDLLDAPGTTA